jgi:DNA invertase Pin-like site-specific DNA recombinase
MPNYRNLSEQQRNILSFALTQNMNIDKEVVEYSSKNRPIEERQQFESFMHSLKEGDAVVADTLSVISYNAEEIVKVINCVLSRGINLYVCNAKSVINKDTPLVEVFPLFNDLREAQKAKTGQIGRPKGSRSSSKFDAYQPQIITFLKEGMSVSAIARKLEVSRSSLKDYIESRGLRELVEGSWMEIVEPSENGGVDNTLLICPFEQEKNRQRSLS